MGNHFWIAACRGLIKKYYIYCCQQFVKLNAPCIGNLPNKSFILALSQFTARRVHGESELRALVKERHNKRIIQHITLIKSVKQALHAISANRIFTDETLRNYLCEVEFILSKRPLTPISDNTHEFEAITPNHLLNDRLSKQ